MGIKYCECGCGKSVKNRFVSGHNSMSRKCLEETRKKISLANKGKKLSQETKDKISKNNWLKRGGSIHPMLGKHHTKEARIKIGLASIGRKCLEETKEKHRRRMVRNKYALGCKRTKEFKDSVSKFHKGKKLSQETKDKIRKSNLGKQDKEKSWNWKGGKSFEPYGLDWTKQFKKSIRERDNNVCQLCNKHQSELKTKLAVHHIDYIKTNIFSFNLISLCMKCHTITNFNRNHWTTFFRNYLNEKYGYVYHSNQRLLSEVYNEY